MRPEFKSSVSQAPGIGEKGYDLGERLDSESPRGVPRYVSGDWRFTNANENRNTGNAERDRFVLVNGRLQLWTDHSQHN